MQRFIHRTIGYSADLCVDLTPLTQTFAVFEIHAKSHLVIIGHFGLTHRGNYPAGAGYGLRVGLRGPGSTSADVSPSVGLNDTPTRWIKGAKVAGNIESVQEHYANPALTGYTLITVPGFYRVEVWGKCHGATNGPVISGSYSAIEVNGNGGLDDPYNSILYQVTEAEGG